MNERHVKKVASWLLFLTNTNIFIFYIDFYVLLIIFFLYRVLTAKMALFFINNCIDVQSFNEYFLTFSLGSS